MGRLQRISTWILLVGLISVPLLAQTTPTTGALLAVISDADGKGLPGVTASISSPALQGGRTTTSNANGEALFPQLPPGTYRLETTLSGFDSQIRDSIVVSLSRVNKVNIAMTLARVSESVTVSGNTVVIDPTQTNTQVNLKEDFLKYASVGQNGRGYQDALEVIPGVADQDGAGGNPSFFGANLGQNSYTIDGLNTTDPVTHTFSANFGFDAIQEIAVQTGGFEAEYGRAVGGIVNVITKSGGNQFAGTLDARYSSDKLTEQGSRIADTPPGTTELANDKNKRDFRTFQPEASIGGPILKDRVWFFADAQRILNQTRAFASQGFEPGRRDFTGWNLFGKVTTTPVSNQTIRFQYTNSYADVPNGEAGSQFYRPEAAQTSYQKLELYNLGWDAVLTDKWTAHIQGGVNVNYLVFQPISHDLLTTGVVDQVTGIRSVNYTNFQESRRDRNQVLGSTTYYLEALGSHAVKIGADVQWDEFRSINNATGTPPDPAFCSPDFGQPEGVTSCGAILRPANGNPNRLDIVTNLPAQKFNGVGQAYYIQDEWRPIQNLTIKLGARYDQNSYDNNLGEHVKTLNRLQPRFGLAYDVFNNSSTVFRAQAGEFMEDLGLTLPSYLSTTGAVTSVFFWSNSRQIFRFAGTFGGPAGNLIDPALRAAYAQEANVGITQRIFTNTSLDVSYVYRRARNIIEDSCAFDNCNTDGTFWLTNNPGGGLGPRPRSDYHGTLVTIQSRPTDRMNILASYTYSTSKGSIEYTQNAGADFDVYPDHFVNRYGYLSDDARHRLKIDGYYRFPFDITFGTHFYWDNGIPYNVTTNDAVYSVRFLEPRGSRRLPHFYQWDAQVQKDFVIGPVRVGLIGSVYNVLNTEIAVLKDGSVGSSPDIAGADNPNFNLNTAYQRPRRYEVGFRVEF